MPSKIRLLTIQSVCAHVVFFLPLILFFFRKQNLGIGTVLVCIGCRSQKKYPPFSAQVRLPLNFIRFPTN